MRKKIKIERSLALNEAMGVSKAITVREWGWVTI